MGFAPNPKAPSRALGCFFLPFLGLGLFFLMMMVRDIIASAATYRWQSVPCQVVESLVRETSDRSPWFAYLRYTWSGGEAIRSSRAFGTYSEALRFTRRWPAGSGTTCYLDPHHPAGTLLEPQGEGFALLLFLPLPLIFIVVGAVGFYSALFRVQPKPRIRPPADSIAGRRFLAALLLIAGSVLFLAFLFGPVRHAIAARAWRPQQGKILRSEVRRFHSSKGSDTFAPVILYSYMVGEQEYRSDLYSFFDPNNGWAAAQRIVARYRRGSPITCYVNPADPDDATLDREPSLIWLVGLLPLALLAGGCALWPRRPSAESLES